jgi:hypothetical protein
VERPRPTPARPVPYSLVRAYLAASPSERAQGKFYDRTVGAGAKTGGAKALSMAATRPAGGARQRN